LWILSVKSVGRSKSVDKVVQERTTMIWKVTDKCTGCGTCVDVCPVDPSLYVLKEDKKTKKKTSEYQAKRADECTECYACTDSCPEGAIVE